MANQQNYDALDVHTLSVIMTNPDSPAEAHAGAFKAISKLDAETRCEMLPPILRKMVQTPASYDDDLIVSVVELLATDPDPQATRIMLDVLPLVLAGGVMGGVPLSAEVREYFYEAVVTRQRESDIAVWAEVLPALQGKTLVAALLDPAAGPIREALEPLTLMERVDQVEQVKALTSLLIGQISMGHEIDDIKATTKKLVGIASEPQLEQVADRLADRWQKAVDAGASKQAALLEAILKVVDKRPRSMGDRLMGRRPWAS